MNKHLICILLLLNAYTGNARAHDPGKLFREIKVCDSLLFDIGFNTCDLSKFEQIVSVDFEFYHDISGMTGTKEAFIASIRDGLCKTPGISRRVLVDSTLEVFPLNKNGKLYGAVQTGVHLFYEQNNQHKERLSSTAKFMHVWRMENGAWRLARVVSYDHRDTAKSINSKPDPLFTDHAATEAWLKELNIPALGIGYISDGKIVEAQVYGSDDQGKPFSEKLLFNVASLTKPVTAMVTLKLIAANKWSLDEPLCNYWTDPDVAHDPRSIKLTTRHILCHSSGFLNWRRNASDGKLSFTFDPGSGYNYSGEGYEYLRKAIMHKFGKSLDQLATELIFVPLAMTDTRFFWDTGVHESQFATWHKKDGSTYPIYKNKEACAADDLITTIEDYSKFIVYVMNGGGLPKWLYREMTSVQNRTKEGQYFGLGWCIDEVTGGTKVLTHGGDDIGVHTIVFFVPETRKGLIIFTNSDNGTDCYIPALDHYMKDVAADIIAIETGK
jgi:CubicO group peptidase (beta-lactamase class C family)